MIDLEKCKEEFLKYTENFNLEIVPIKRKQLHSLRVMEKSKEIAKSLNLSEKEVEIATLIGLLHDIGRFEQYTKYKTFTDHKSVDHAKLGVEILKKDNYIKKYITDEKWIKIIYTAILNHNKFKIQEGLSEKELLFCKIIRDADKADIMYEGAKIFWNTKEEVENINKEFVEDVVLESVRKHQLIDRTKLENENELDSMIIMLCFTFDINYAKTFEIIDKENSINQILGRFKFENKETKEKMQEIGKTIIQYIKEKENYKNGL